MKKILLFVVALMSATMMQAGLELRVEGNVIERDTTITVNHMKYADFTGEAAIEWEGTMFYNQGKVTVYVERPKAGLRDELCAGMCRSGNEEILDTLEYDLTLYAKLPVQVYGHFYPESKSVETIKYRFVGGGDDFTLTVKYDASAMAVEQVVDTKKSVKVIRNGQVIIVRDGVEYNALGAKL